LSRRLKKLYRYKDEEEPREFTIEDSQDGVMPSVCDGTFFWQWQLPYKHVWHHYVTFGSLTPAIMKEWEWMWEDRGFELYEGRTTEYIEKGIREEIGVLFRRRLDLREVLDSLKSRWYQLEAEVAHMLSEDTDYFMRLFVTRLYGFSKALGD
jgi:hypothetical protein